MICGFIDEDFRYVIKEITEDEAADVAAQDKYFSIGINGEYYIFFIKETYTEENLDKIMKVTAELNKELMIQNNQLKESKMRDIKILDYYIFVNSNDEGSRHTYKTLEELCANVPRHVSNINKRFGKGNMNINIGASFDILERKNSKRYSEAAFIRRRIGEERFVFCKDIEELKIRLPKDVEEKFEGLIKLL